jgi:HSP20 family protein
MTSLVRWEPLRDLMGLQHDVERLLYDVGMPRLSRPLLTETLPAVPTTDVFTRGEDLVIRAEMPGIKPDEIDISVTDDILTFKADREAKHEVKEEDFVLREMTHGHFERTMRLPASVEPGAIRAEYQDGILEITVPKAAPEVGKTHRVAVEVHSAEKPEEHH